MKFLADENISSKVVGKLRNKGIDIVSVKEFASGISDESVLELANKQKRVVITFDDDFGELIYGRKLRAQGIILLKFVPKSSQQIVDTITNVLATQAQIEGHFVTVTEKRIRVLRLKMVKGS
jgi:predicted nuclease of predicted toxin-antitoxin system